MAGVAAPERAAITSDATPANLSPSKKALEASFPVLSPGNMPPEVGVYMNLLCFNAMLQPRVLTTFIP